MNYLTKKNNLIENILTYSMEYSVEQLNKMNVEELLEIHDQVAMEDLEA